MKKISLILLSLAASTAVQAQAYQGFVEQFKLEIILALAVMVCVLALLVLLVCLYALRVFLNLGKEPKAAPKVSWWQSLMEKMTKTVPLEQESQVMTDHEYDGIKELDNQLPPWWVYGFYFTIIFAVVYLLYFHVLGYGQSSAQEYTSEMQKAEEHAKVYLASLENSIDESNVELLTLEADITAAKGVFTQYCVACHGQLGEGGVGPNLTDSYWLHGGDVKSIFKTIKYGVSEKGMISWQNQLSPKQMQQMSSFILTLQGTNPPNPKEPQGVLIESGTFSSDSTATL